MWRFIKRLFQKKYKEYYDNDIFHGLCEDGINEWGQEQVMACYNQAIKEVLSSLPINYKPEGKVYFFEENEISYEINNGFGCFMCIYCDWLSIFISCLENGEQHDFIDKWKRIRLEDNYITMDEKIKKKEKDNERNPCL